jgi:hypothetical protein
MRSLRSLWSGLPGTTLLILLAGCTGANDDNGISSATSQSAVGIWSGIESVTGLAVTAIVDSSGETAFVRSDGAQFAGTAQTSGSSLAVAVDGYSNFPTTFPDGTTTGVGTISGTVTTSTTMTVTLSFTTSGETAITGTWTLSYNSLSTLASSLAAVNANYSDGTTGSTVSIDGLGDVNSQDATTGCVMNGTISTSDTAYDIYQTSFTYKNCTGDYAILNDVDLAGLAVLDTGVSPQQLVIAVTGQSSSGSYGITSYLNAT